MARKQNRGGRNDRYGRPRTFVGSISTCHLCLLPLLKNIVSPEHPLFLTLDHILPLSRGGPDVASNRAPAHRSCNKSKADSIEVPWKARIDMTYVIAPLLERAGLRITNKRLAKIRNEIRSQFGGTPKHDVLPDLIRWEDDGGTPYVRPHWRGGALAAS
jgi:hypothetical protein